VLDRRHPEPGIPEILRDSAVPNEPLHGRGRCCARRRRDQSMQAMDILQSLFRWVHVGAGIVWIGMLYFFNFVNANFAATMDGETKKKVVPELMPRALYWFRWGAVWTWLTGFLLLLLVFYHGGILFDAGYGWGLPAIVMLLLSLVFAPLIYDAIMKAMAPKNVMGGIVVCFLLLAVIAFSWRTGPTSAIAATSSTSALCSGP
jgi:uncharacterized membrane protein